MRKSVIIAASRGFSSVPEDEGSSSSASGSRPASSKYNSPSTFRVTGGNFGPLLGAKPFKTPSSLRNKQKEVEGGGRKRKVVDYKGMGAGGGDDDDEDAEIEPEQKKRNKKFKEIEGFKGVDGYGRSLTVVKREAEWGTFKPKDFKTLSKSTFKTPTMTDKVTGELIINIMTAPALGNRKAVEIPPRPLFDPMQDTAIVLYDPTIHDRDVERENEKLRLEQSRLENAVEEEPQSEHKSLAKILGLDRKKDKVIQKVPVVVDPRLTKILRPHQVEGVKFLYKCATGLIVDNAYGCIMADEMGLGKTLQCIALMWTLLKQSPNSGKPTIDKCIIACPSSLVRNWANELTKWLGSAAPHALALDGKLQKDEMVRQVVRWCDAKGRAVTSPVLIVSYETLRNLQPVLAGTEVGLLLCDEGHRLKNSDSQTFVALDQIHVKRRVILSGTPIQNDLTEYFSLLNFANPTLLGNRQEFRKNYEIAILKGRDSLATDKQKELGLQKLKELSAVASKFIIRRTNDLLSKYLPVKHEHVVFCGLSTFQLALYRHFINSPDIRKLLRGKGSQPLKAIGILKKLCNHPDLLDLPSDLEGCEEFFPEDYVPNDRRNVHVEYSGKMIVLERFLRTIKNTTNDKIVLISNYTQTLDIFDNLCRANKWGSFRLDGTMAVKKRQKLVDRFNDPESPEFVFLLSSKAGGCGLNLIGANRLVLFDPDWNPASDQQALARVWRDGQKKSCFVYRFIATGSIEEKILQRQSHKQSLSSCVVDEAQDAERHFSGEDLRALFLYKEDTISDTHDTYKCKRCKDGKQWIKSPAMLYGDTSTWNHFPNSQLGKLHDDLLRAEMGQPEVSYVFQYCSH